MGVTCSTLGEIRSVQTFEFENLNELEHLKDVFVDPGQN